MKAQTQITIRFADCDPMGHTNNAKYFTYMEQARVALFRKALDVQSYEPISSELFPFILAEISCRFLKPTYVDETLIIEARVSEVKNTSFFIKYDIKDEQTGELVATGKSAQVSYNYDLKKASPIPDGLRKKLNE